MGNRSDIPSVEAHVSGPRGHSRRTVLAGSLALGATLLLPGEPRGRASAPDLPKTAKLLERESRLHPVGVFRTEYQVPSPPPDTTLDLRRATFFAYHDKDAVYETGPFSRGSSAHQKNHRPVRIGDEAPASRFAVVGGVVQGDQPVELPWIRMKYGQAVQVDTDDWVASGRPESVDPYRRVVDNANQDGDVRIRVAAGSWAVVDGLRVRNTHDGLGIYGDGSGGAGATVAIRNSWFQDIHDDGVENDEWQDVYISDCLFERVYSLVSTRPSGRRRPRARTRARQRVVDCVASLWPFPGGHKQNSTTRSHETVFKTDDDSPGLQVVRSVILVEDFITRSAAHMPERRADRGDAVTDEYSDVTIVWRGRGEYPGNVPVGCRLTTDVGVYERASMAWKRRHGVSSFTDVDTTRLLAPTR